MTSIRPAVNEVTSSEAPFDIKSFYLGPSNMESNTAHTSMTSHLNHDLAHPRNAKSSTCSSSTKSVQLSQSDTRSSITSFDGTATINIPRVNMLQLGKSVDDRYLALGTIKLFRNSESELCTRGRDRDEKHPHRLINLAQSRGWMAVDDLSDDQSQGPPRIRVYIIPEDVDRVDRGTLKEFRKVVQLLLSVIDRSTEAWLGTYEDDDIAEPFETCQANHEESLFYIFNTLQSPSPNLSAVQNSSDGYQAVYDVIKDEIFGLRTQLYSYQRRSIAAMIQRESEPAKMIDPRKTLFKDIYGRPFYLDTHDGTLVKTPPLYPEPQGGILAETMGYGKTLICLALILATRGHYPRIPGDRVDNISIQERPKVASLLSMAAKKIKDEGIPWKSDFHRLKKTGFHYDVCLQELAKYDRAYDEPTFNPTTPTRSCKPESSNLIRLCSATLVVVPPNLLLQWQHELRKHIEKDALDVLVIDALTKEIPSWQKLLDYDLVLITKLRFEQEYQDDDLNQGKRKRGNHKYRSPLTRVRWLRVICDEGHGFAGSSSHTRAMAMLDNMYIERRWVVSGTPSSTLHGVEVEFSTANLTSTDDPRSPGLASPETPGRRDSINTTLQKRMAPSSFDQETKDLERLRIMVVKFLHLQPWANQRGKDNANWKRYLAPVLDASGKRITPPGLREVLQTLIIRHRIEDIDTDLTLPPLYNHVVYLKPSYHDKLALNMFSLVLTSNYVTSEREDEDYMFHPKNRKKFDLLVNNLRHATFHWVGFSKHDIKETLRVSKEYLEGNANTISSQDLVLLEDAIDNAKRALTDPSWLSFSKMHEIGCYATLFPNTAREAWALDGRDNDPVLLGTVQAREAQKFFQSQVLKGVHDPLSTLAGRGLMIMNAVRAEADKDEVENSKSRAANGEKQQAGAIEEPRLRVVSSSASMKGNTTPPKKAVKPRKCPASSPRVSSDMIGQAPQSKACIQPHYMIDTPRTFISGFTSAKLAYLADQLLIHSKTSKSIVFYSSNNTAFWTAEALELLHIPFLIYANTLTVAQRNNYLSMFNADDSIKVLLMDVKQASHGLHIASANRVYIIAPIWDKGVESQAIKRAHRIGQTRAVHVETLVLKGTFEEEIIKRRQDIDQNGVQSSMLQDMTTTSNGICITDSNHQYREENRSPISPTKGTSAKRQNAQSLLDDRHMVQVLKDLNFLKFSEDEDEHIHARIAKLHCPKEQRLFFGTPSASTGPKDLHDRIMTDLAHTNEGQGVVNGGTEDIHDERPRKKARTVGFQAV